MLQSDRQPDTGEAGYFLTDAVVALFVLASVAGSLMGAFGIARSLAARADHSAKALVVARSCMEEHGVEARERTFGLGGVEYLQVRSIRMINNGERHVVQLVRITCTARWIERGIPAEVRLERLEARARPA